MGDGLESIFDLIETPFWGEDSRLRRMLVGLKMKARAFELTLESYLLDMVVAGEASLNIKKLWG